MNEICSIVGTVVGLACYIFLPQQKSVEIGRIMFFCGLLSLLIHNGNEPLSRLLGH